MLANWTRMREQQQIEWKVPKRDEYLRWICGFGIAEILTEMDAELATLEQRREKTRPSSRP